MSQHFPLVLLNLMLGTLAQRYKIHQCQVRTIRMLLFKQKNTFWLVTFFK
uniref:Pco121713 n=1 Tax=Arundo donax TaxID=35708 RepID=A0A0A9EWD4_ARUDO